MTKQKTWGHFTLWPAKQAPARTIDGRSFRLFATNPAKVEAQALAGIMRRRGYLARVRKATNKRHYEVLVAPSKEDRQRRR